MNQKKPEEYLRCMIEEQRREISTCRKDVVACQQEVATLRECLRDAGLLRSSSFMAKLHQRQFMAGWQAFGFHSDVCLEMALRVHEIALCVGLYMGITAARLSGLASRAAWREISRALPLIRELCDGYIYVLGGSTNEDPILDSVERYSPASGKWDVLPNMVRGRGTPSAGILDDGLYICGGLNSNDQAMRSVERLRLGTCTWETLPSLLTARYAACAASIAGKLWICGGGGRNSDNEQDAALRSTECFDPARIAWDMGPTMLVDRFWAAAGVVGGRLHLCGGRTGDLDGTLVLNSAECLEPGGTWKELPPMSTARACAAAGTVGGKLYVCGGWGQNLLIMNSVERFNRVEKTWETVVPMSVRRSGAAGACLAGRLYIFGGQNEDEELLRSAEYYDPATGKWTGLMPMRARRDGAAAVASQS